VIPFNINNALEQLKKEEEERAKKLPTTAHALLQISEARYRLKDLGWKDPVLNGVPPRTQPFICITFGSIGVFKGVWLGSAGYFIEDGGDFWPAHIAMWKHFDEKEWQELQQQCIDVYKKGEQDAQSESEGRDLHDGKEEDHH
jgi:hypothetical protein